MGIYLLCATWVHEYMAIFVNTEGIQKEVYDFDKTWSASQ